MISGPSSTTSLCRREMIMLPPRAATAHDVPLASFEYTRRSTRCRRQRPKLDQASLRAGPQLGHRSALRFYCWSAIAAGDWMLASRLVALGSLPCGPFSPTPPSYSLSCNKTTLHPRGVEALDDSSKSGEEGKASRGSGLEGARVKKI